MQNKSTTSTQLPQHLLAGLNQENQTDVEFFGIKKNQTVQFLKSGQVHYFGELPPSHYVLLLNKFNADLPARTYFSQFDITMTRKVELYTYYLYGSLDHKPDIINGVLQPSENFRDSINCPSLKFSEKKMNIDGERLTLRDLIIIDMAARECTNFEIAMTLGIKESSLDTYMRNTLFKKTNTQTKLGLVSKSYQNQIL